MLKLPGLDPADPIDPTKPTLDKALVDGTFYDTHDGGTIKAGDGKDTFIGGLFGSRFDGGEGEDIADYSGYWISGVDVDLESGIAKSGFHGSGSNTLVNVENVIGTDFSDRISGDAEDNIIHGRGGSDYLSGRSGDDVIHGGEGFDHISGGRGRDQLYGGDDRDILEGGRDADHIDGGHGDQDAATYASSDGAVNVSLERGTGVGGHAQGDTLVNIEYLVGSDYDDILTGDKGANLIAGGAGGDTINGGQGDDYFIGGQVLFAQATESRSVASDGAADIFVFENDRRRGPDLEHGDDTISDFEVGIDKIDLSRTEVDDWDDIDDDRGNYGMYQDGDDTVIYTLNGRESDTIRLVGIDVDDVSESDFIFS